MNIFVIIFLLVPFFVSVFNPFKAESDRQTHSVLVKNRTLQRITSVIEQLYVKYYNMIGITIVKRRKLRSIKTIL